MGFVQQPCVNKREERSGRLGRGVVEAPGEKRAREITNFSHDLRRNRRSRRSSSRRRRRERSPSGRIGGEESQKGAVEGLVGPVLCVYRRV